MQRVAIDHHTGRFWRIDHHGLIENDASAEQIDTAYREAVDAVIEAYRDHLGDDLHSIYLRGTIARGVAIDGLSDLDSLALVRSAKADGSVSWQDGEEVTIVTAHPLLTGVQFETYAATDVARPETVSELLVVLATQSVCIDGLSVLPDLPRLRPDAAVANIDIVQIAPDIAEARDALSKAGAPGIEVTYWCRRIMKNVLRCGASLALVDQGVFTRDLAPCLDVFCRAYPAERGAMTDVLGLALNPTTDAGAPLQVLESFGTWMIAEADRWLDRYNPARLVELPLLPRT